MRREPWSVDKEKRLRSMWLKGVQLKIIAYRLETTQGAIHAKRQRLGLKTRIDQEVKKDKNLHIKIDEATLDAIRKAASVLGVTMPVYVRNIIRAELKALQTTVQTDSK